MSALPPGRLLDAVHAALVLIATSTVLLAATPDPARASCALIPSAVQQLTSDDGSVDRPIAAPGETVTLFADGACKAGPGYSQFDKTATNNEVTLSFEPPYYPPSPAVCGNGTQEAGEFCDDGNTDPYDGCSAKCAPEVTVVPTSVKDCGETRCFALRFDLPDTTPVTGSYPLTGPARIRARNTVSGQTVVDIGKLFDPKRGCNNKNGARNVFRHFTVLPPLNNFDNITSGLRATVDGSGSLLVPFDYGTVLAGTFGVGGEGALRILNAQATLPNGLVGGNGLSGLDGDLIRIPRRGRFLRAFSFNGRPIPPLLDVSGSLLLDSNNVAYGDHIVSSVDFVESVIRISRVGQSPQWGDPPGTHGGVPVEVFRLASAPGADPGGLALTDGIGPIQISFGNVSLSAGAAAPLSSLKPSRDVVVLARDEKLEAPFGQGDQNGDPDNDDRVVHFINVDDGSTFTTGQAVTELGPPPKAATDSEGTIVSFLQSEAHQGRTDYLSNSTTVDSILRVWSADPAHPSCGSVPCELTAGLTPVQTIEPSFAMTGPDKQPGPVIVDGPDSNPGLNTFYAVAELAQTGLGGTARASLRPGNFETTGASRDPAVSSTGLRLAYTSQDTGLVAAAPVTWESGTVSGHADGATGVATGSFAFNAGDDDVAGLDYSSVGGGTFSLQFSPTANPLVFDVFGSWAAGVGPLFQADWAFGDAQASPSDAIIVDTSYIDTTGSPTITTNAPLTNPSVFGIGSIQSYAHVDVVDGTIVDDGFGNLSYDYEGIFTFSGQQAVSGEQIYVEDLNNDGSVSGQQLASRNAAGAPGNAASGLAALDFDGTHVAFGSDATNLVASDVNGRRDVFLVELSPFSIQRASQKAGVGGNGDSFEPDLDDTGTLVAYTSLASNLGASPDGNGVSDVFVYDSTSGLNQRISVGVGGGNGNGASQGGVISGNGRYVAFGSAATNLTATADTNGVSDVFVRDRVAGTTVRASVALGGGQANGASSNPDIDQGGRIVAFESAATNLVPADVNLMGVTQCYVRDLDSGLTQLVSANLGGDGGNAPCSSPHLSSDGRSVVFVSASTNLHPERTASPLARPYVFDRLTGVVEMFGLNTSFPVVGAADGDNVLQTVGAYATADDMALFGITDTNFVNDVYFGIQLEGSSLNDTGPFADSDGTDVVLHAFDADAGTVRESDIPVGKVAIGGASLAGGDGGKAYVIPAGAGAQELYFWDPQAGAPQANSGGVLVTAVSASEFGACAIDQSGNLQVAIGAAVSAVPGPQPAAEVKAHGGRCIFRTPSNELRITDMATLVTDATGQTVRDFQVGGDGVAFRTCEQDLVPPADLNGDTDTADCVMSFWAFDPAVPMDYLRQTSRVAVPCKLPGCDPFFEPYRVTGGVVSFVTDERVETNGAGQRGVTCLPTSPAGLCDVTGDDDGNDVAVEIFSIDSGQSQVFPLDEQNPPDVAPFPQLTESEAGDETGVLVVQLPASVLGDDFASLNGDELVTVLVGDPDNDGTFEADGNLDPQTTVVDLCKDVADPTQADEDADGVGTDCDVVETVDANDEVVSTQPNDDPVAPVEAAAIPGENLCDLNKSGIISRAEVDSIWEDRGLLAGRPVDRNGDQVLEPGDDRDPDADGEITAVDFRLCLNSCAAQTGGCPDTEPATGSGGYKAPSCGLLGIEALLGLIPLALRRRRMRT